MNTLTAADAVQWLFLDLNAFFASISSRPPPVFPKASAISMSWSRNCAQRRARTILRSIC
jgi:hypothetical protein